MFSGWADGISDDDDGVERDPDSTDGPPALGPSCRRYGSVEGNFAGDWRCAGFCCVGIVGTGDTSPNDLTSGSSALISTGPETLLTEFRGF